MVCTSGAVDSEKTGEESEIPRMKLLYESESDDDDTPIAGQPLPQTPGFDDSTDDEQETGMYITRQGCILVRELYLKNKLACVPVFLYLDIRFNY